MTSNPTVSHDMISSVTVTIKDRCCQRDEIGQPEGNIVHEQISLRNKDRIVLKVGQSVVSNFQDRLWLVLQEQINVCPAYVERSQPFYRSGDVDVVPNVLVYLSIPVELNGTFKPIQPIQSIPHQDGIH